MGFILKYLFTRIDFLIVLNKIYKFYSTVLYLATFQTTIKQINLDNFNWIFNYIIRFLLLFLLIDFKAAVQILEQPDIPSIKVVAPGGKKTNVTKGFDIQQKDTFRSLTPRSQSPASRCDSPVVDKVESNAQGESSAEDARITKQRENAIALYQKERSENKQHLYMVVIGHVDAGKSTLMGHLLCALGQV